MEVKLLGIAVLSATLVSSSSFAGKGGATMVLENAGTAVTKQTAQMTGKDFSSLVMRELANPGTVTAKNLEMAAISQTQFSAAVAGVLKVLGVNSTSQLNSAQLTNLNKSVYDAVMKVDGNFVAALENLKGLNKETVLNATSAHGQATTALNGEVTDGQVRAIVAPTARVAQDNIAAAVTLLSADTSAFSKENVTYLTTTVIPATGTEGNNLRTVTNSLVGVALNVTPTTVCKLDQCSAVQVQQAKVNAVNFAIGEVRTGIALDPRGREIAEGYVLGGKWATESSIDNSKLVAGGANILHQMTLGAATSNSGVACLRTGQPQ